METETAFQIASAAGEKTFLQSFTEFADFLFYSPLFTVIKFLALIYVTVLIVDLILLLILSGVGESYHKNKRGVNLPIPSEARRKWKSILKRLDKGQENYRKAAVLEADQYVEKILRNVGYQGEGMQDLIDQLKLQDSSLAEDLQEAHDESVRIVREVDAELSRERAEEILDKYRRFLEAIEVFG